MDIISVLDDGRINASNALIQMTIGEYIDLVQDAIHNNPYQRKRISASKTIYELLKLDVQRGCIVPPIVLAVTTNIKLGDLDRSKILEFVTSSQKNILILDGLQRTTTFLDLQQELQGEEKDKFINHQLRVEIYLGLNKLGILYRMLTLNTGQTPMSIRHQIEILYSDYLEHGIEDVIFVREIDAAHATNINELNFRDAIEGFNSYLERDELPLDRSDILENIKSLESISQENSSTDIFKDYVLSWLAFYKHVTNLCDGAEYRQDGDSPEKAAPWGKTAYQVFRKAQVLSGFGAAIGKLKDYNKISDISSIIGLCSSLRLSDCDAESFLQKINNKITWINKNAKKIGNSQRIFFQFYFRDLFNNESDSYLLIDLALDTAMHKLQSQIL